MPGALVIPAALILLLLVLHDAFEVMLVPRRVKSPLRIVRVFFRGAWWLWSSLARGRASILSLFGPLSMIGLLFVWAAGLIVAFALIFWRLDTVHFGFLPHLYASGATFFTLGNADFVPDGAAQKSLTVIEAGIGLAFLATVIGYLPVLYQLFARRESQVLLLDAVAGSPPSASTLLVRHSENDSLVDLENLLTNWRQWCAELLESQLSYPMLAFYRSQHDNQSWLSALAAIMDCCALQMVGFKGVRTFHARLTFAIAREAVIEMGRVFHISPRTAENSRLPSEQFEDLRTRLAAAGLIFSEESDAEQRLTAFRDTYEPFLLGLARYLVMELPEWLPAENQIDNWQNSPRGKTARQLIESVQVKPE